MSIPDPDLIDAIFIDKVRRARQMSVAEKMDATGELFDYACEISRGGIRAEHPDASDERVEELLRERLRIGRILEQRPWRATES